MRTSIAFLIAAVFLFVLAVPAGAQTGRTSVLYPAPLEPWQVRGLAGATVTVLPRPIAEEEIRHIPMLDLGVRLGLPHGASLVAMASSNVIANTASVGAQWSYAFDRYSITVGDRHAYWYGATQIEGFDASAYGWMNHPYVSIGADYKEVRVLVRAEMTWVFHRSSRVGEQEVAFDDDFIAGSAFTVALEQPFIDSTDVTVGLRLNVTESAVQSWLAFSTFRDRLVFPEIFFSVTL